MGDDDNKHLRLAIVALFDADGLVILPWRFRNYLERGYGISPQVTREFYNGISNESSG